MPPYVCITWGVTRGRTPEKDEEPLASCPVTAKFCLIRATHTKPHFFSQRCKCL